MHIVAIDGFADAAVARFPHERASLGQVGRMLASFARAGVREVVIAGAMQRPNLLRLKIDMGFLRNLPTVLSLTRGGDDSVLRRIVRFFEGHGLTVVGVGDVAPELLAPAGHLGRHLPDESYGAVLERAGRLIAALAPFDVGQAVTVASDGVVAVEGVRGTDAMLRDLGPDAFAAGLGRGAVLVKLPKPGQEMRIDLPTIGPETVRRAREAGLAGIAIAAGGAIVLDRARVIEEADAAGLFVTGFAPALPGSPAGPQAAAGATGGILRVHSRRAPTPTDRRDIGIGRRLVDAMAANGAGEAAIVSREHVVAIAAALPLAPFVAAQGRPSSWGRRTFKQRLGVLVLSAGAARAAPGPENVAPGEAEAATTPVIDGLDEALFRSAMTAGLAGIVCFAPLGEGAWLAERVAWANEAGLFLMATEQGS